MKRTGKTSIRMTAALLSAAFAVLSLVFVSSADDPPMPAFTLYAVRYSDGIYGIDLETDENGIITRIADERDIRLDVFAEGNNNAVWSSPDDAETMIADGTVTAKSGVLSLDLSDEPLDIAWCHELTMLVVFASPEAEANVTLKITTAEAEYEASALAEAGIPYLLAAPLAPIPDGERITGISIIADGASEISVSDIFADNRTLVDFLGRYGAADFTGKGGSLSTEYGKVVFTPDGSSDCRIGVSSVILTAQAQETNCCIILSVTSTTNGDEMSLYAGENMLGTAVLSSGTHKYSFRTNGESAASYSLSFTPSSEVSAYELEDTEMFSFAPGSSFVTEPVGKVTDVRISKSHLTVTGSISSAVVVSHIGSKIGVYELPLGTKPDEANGLLPVTEIDISTQFNIAMPLDSCDLSPETSMYAAAIVTDDGPLFIAEPRCARAKTNALPFEESVVGLYGATTAGIFESNAAHAVLDIDFAALTGGTVPNKVGALASANGKYFCIDEAAIAELDRKIGFCDAANVRVYLRIMSSVDMSELGYTADAEISGSYPFNLSGEDGRAYFTAVMSFISSRYPSVVGYIISNPATEAADGTDAELYAASYAEAVCVMNNILARSSSPAVVYATFTDGGIGTATPAIIYKMMDYRLSLTSGQSFGIAWDGTVGAYIRFENSVLTIGESEPENTVMFYRPELTGITSVVRDYAAFAEEADALYVRAAFLDVPKPLTESRIYDEISAAMNQHTSSRHTVSGEIADSGITYSGEVRIWDFSSSFSAPGWLSGDGCKSVITEQRDCFGDGKRSLEATFTHNSEMSGAGGVLICDPSETIRLSSADAFRIVLYASSDADTAEIRVILSCGDTRYEYTATAETNRTVTIDCDTSVIESTRIPDYIAIVVRSDSDIKLNIARSSALSKTMSDAEISYAVYNQSGSKPQSRTETDVTKRDMIIAAAVGAFVVSVIMFALLSRKKKQGD